MRALERPKPEHVYDADLEIQRLRTYRDTEPGRQIPTLSPGHVLVATWNVANLGVHVRREADCRVIAELLSWFEIVGVQEVADDLEDFRRVLTHLPSHFAALFTDRAGNDERAAYLYDTRRVSLGSKIGEVAIVDSDRRYVTLPGIDRPFLGFNRNPYLASFRVEGTDLLLANCHLLYGPTGSAAEEQESLERRQLEAYAIARWCDLRRQDSHTYTRDILAVGDFNLPKKEPGDPIYDALTRRGLHLPPHQTTIPTNVSGDKDYDQIAVAPGLKNRIVALGVFDFDGVLFHELWNPPQTSYWRTCAKYYVSDHRPLWARLALT
jgi:endonuclease/exonuclease/phosphatase family metal-dependent hydrolase